LSSNTGGADTDDPFENAKWSAGELEENNTVMNPIVTRPRRYSAVLLSSPIPLNADELGNDSDETALSSNNDLDKLLAAVS